MQKTAVLIYQSFCAFELSVALESLALAEKEIVVFSKNKLPVQSEERLMVLPDRAIAEVDSAEFDSLLLTGAADIREAIEDQEVIDFIKKFADKIIGAISIAPILLVKAGLLKGLPFMIGANREELYEEGFKEEDLSHMISWDDNLRNPVKNGYLISDNIITSVSYNFVHWGVAFARMLGIDIESKTFGV